LKCSFKILTLAGVLFWGGCAQFDNQPLKPQANLTDFESRSLSDPNLQSFLETHRPQDHPLHSGWNAADLTLAAFFYQPNLAVARAQWTVAQSGIAQAGEIPNPTLGIAPAFNTSTPTDLGISPWVLGMSLDFPLDLPKQRRARIAQARSQAQVAWLSFVETAWQTRVCVREAMLNLYQARQTLHLQQSRVEILKQHATLLGQQQQAGAVDRPTVQQAEQTLGHARLDLLEAEKARATALTVLAAAVGLPAEALRDARFNFEAFAHLPETIPDTEVCRQALMNRADILGQLTAYDAAQARLQWEVTRQMPEFSLGPAYEFDQDDHKWGLGASLTLPVFNQNQAAIETARQQRTMEAARFYALQARVLGHLEQAIARYGYAYRQYHLAHALHQSKQADVALLEKQAAAGALSRGALWEGRLAVLQSEQQRLTALIEAQAVLGQLEQEMQSPVDLPNWQAALSQSNPKTGVASHSGNEAPHED